MEGGNTSPQNLIFASKLALIALVLMLFLHSQKAKQATSKLLCTHSSTLLHIRTLRTSSVYNSLFVGTARQTDTHNTHMHTCTCTYGICQNECNKRTSVAQEKAAPCAPLFSTVCAALHWPRCSAPSCKVQQSKNCSTFCRESVARSPIIITRSSEALSKG